MTTRRSAIRPVINDRHRTIPEPLILDMLLLYGWVFELAAGRRAAALRQCEAALEGLVQGGLGFRRIAGARCFDPVEVHNLITSEGVAGRCHIWADRFIPTARAHYRELAEGGREQIFHVKLSRRLTLPKTHERLRLNMPVPIACSYLRDVHTTVAPLPGMQSRMRDGCVDVRLEAPAPETATITALAEFTTAAAEAGTMTAEERLLYLRPAENFIRVTPRIAGLAASLGGGAPDPRAKVTTFWNFMLDHLMLGMIRYSDIPPHAPGDWVLDHGWFDCLIGSSLFIALCRAQGVPARLVGGHLLYRRFPANHYWAECWLDGAGWRPYDLMAWDLSEAGRAAAWRDVFAGRCDPRMVTEILPLRFTGPMSLRLPAEWHMVQTREGDGLACGYHEALAGSLIYRDQIEFV